MIFNFIHCIFQYLQTAEFSFKNPLRVLDCIECIGPRTFLRDGAPCIKHSNHYFTTTLLYSILLGFLGKAHITSYKGIHVKIWVLSNWIFFFFRGVYFILYDVPTSNLRGGTFQHLCIYFAFFYCHYLWIYIRCTTYLSLSYLNRLTCDDILFNKVILAFKLLFRYLLSRLGSVLSWANWNRGG